VQQAGGKIKGSGNPGSLSSGPANISGRDNESPTSTAAHDGMKPAIGPAIPISNKAARVGIGF